MLRMMSASQRSPRHSFNDCRWLQNNRNDWRDAECPCGSVYHFDGEIEKLFSWETVHLPHMASDYANHDMLSFYPKNMVIYYHSKSGYVIELREHRAEEIESLRHACVYGGIKLAGV
jgi:hypothetical protein